MEAIECTFCGEDSGVSITQDDDVTIRKIPNGIFAPDGYFLHGKWICDECANRIVGMTSVGL